MIKTVLDEVDRATRREKRPGGRSNEGVGATRRVKNEKVVKQDPEVNDASSSHFFIFHFFTTFSFFHSPRRSFLLVAPSSSPLLPPRPSFLLVPLSSSSSTVSIT